MVRMVRMVIFFFNPLGLSLPFLQGIRGGLGQLVQLLKCTDVGHLFSLNHPRPA